MKRLRKLTAVVLVMLLCTLSVVPAFAYSEESAELKADALNAMNLLKGSDIGYELERTPTRMESLAMLIRLLGKENEALYGEGYTHPFVDAPIWPEDAASRYLAYAYTEGLINGIDETHFNPDVPASAQMFATYVLRALGYQDSESGSVWNQWESLLRQAMKVPDDLDCENFRRGDMVSLSYAALDAKVQGTDMTLSEKLISERAISDLALRMGRVIAGELKVTKDSPLADIMAYLYASVHNTLHISNLREEEVTADNIEYYLGTDTVKITEGLAVEPTMLAMAHSVCLVRLPEGADVEATKQTIRENVNPNKWICVGVDESNVFVENIGNLVLLAMDNSCGSALANAFRALDTSLIAPDKDGMIYLDGMYIQAPDALDIDSVTNYAEKLSLLREKYFPENNVYVSIIPDKSYFARGQIAQYLDHESMADIVDSHLSDWTSIDLTGALTLEDFYLTDPHWKQEELDGVCKALGEKMGFTIDMTAFQPNTYDLFTGSYNRIVPDIKPETLTYLTSQYTESSVVSNMQTPSVKTVYNTELLDGESAYNVFLSGLSPLTVIENKNAVREKQLILFSDSYGSSLAPLLLEQYSKITLIDLRFMLSDMLGDYVQFDSSADVLFLQSAEIVNHSNILK